LSSQLYPTLPGLQFNTIRSYQWNTQYKEALSGKQSTISYRQYPLVHFELDYEILRDLISPSEFKAIVGLHNQMRGRWDTFLFTDPDFNTITSGNASQYGKFGTGDGSTLVFQLTASYQNSGGPGQAELIQNLNGTPVFYDNGSTISAANYSIGATGIVTFGAGHAPASGHSLTWSGSFYYRCRFDEDAIDWKKYLTGRWQATVQFTSVKL
jgi:uncharacterized protein (TIGR02217 family)